MPRSPGGYSAGPRRSRPRPRGWAYLSGGFGLSVNSMVGLLVPLRAAELGMPVGRIGVILSAGAAAEILLAVPVGALIGRIGARAGVILGTAGCTAVGAGFALAGNFWPLLALNAAMGAGRALAWVAAQTYIASTADPQERARDTGRFSFVSNASQMVAPLLVGGAASVLGYRPAFLVLAGYAAAFTVVGVLLPRQPPLAAATPVRLSAAVRLFGIPRFRIAMLLTFVRLWVPAMWTPFFPFFLVRAGFSPGLAGLVVAAAAAVATAVSLLTGPLSRRAAPEVLCIVALGAATLGLLLSPVLMSVPAVFVPAALVGVGNGLSLPLLILLVSEAAPAEQRGLALSTRAAVNQVAAALAPLGLAPLAAVLGMAGGFAVTGGFAAALLAGAAQLHVRQRSGRPRPLG